MSSASATRSSTGGGGLALEFSRVSTTKPGAILSKFVAAKYNLVNNTPPLVEHHYSTVGMQIDGTENS